MPVTPPAQSLPETSQPESPGRGLSSPAAFIGVVAVSALVIILCVLGLTMSGIFGRTSPGSDGAPVAASPDVATAGTLLSRFDDGEWLVGADIRPGTYATTVPVGSSGCVWERRDSADGTARSVLESGVGDERQKLVVDIKPTDKVFQSAGCGHWQLTP